MKRKRKKSKIWWGKESILDESLAAVIVSEGYIVELIWDVEDVGVGLYVGDGVGGGVGTWPSNLRKGWKYQYYKRIILPCIK